MKCINEDNQLKRELYKKNKTTAKNIKLLRLMNGETQQTISDLLHLSRSAYFSLETGTKIPDFDTLCILSDYYNVDIDYLISFDICALLLNMMQADRDELKAHNFIKCYFMLSHRGKECIASEIMRIKEFEDKHKTFPWKYEDCSEKYLPVKIEHKRKLYERRNKYAEKPKNLTK